MTGDKVALGGVVADLHLYVRAAHSSNVCRASCVGTLDTPSIFVASVVSDRPQSDIVVSSPPL